MNTKRTVQDDIISTKQVIKRFRFDEEADQIKGFDRCYSFTNERLRKYLSLFDLKNKKALTVTASGDHPLNIIEVATDVKLRDEYKLSDGDIVEVYISE